MSNLRHACLACGGSCKGVRVRLLPDEVDRMAEYGAQLGIDNPVIGDALRQNWGRCVFLDDQNRCRIHGTFGGENKPRTCQQYPLVHVSTEADTRMGIDPGCYTAFWTHAKAPPLQPDHIVGSDVHYDDATSADEIAILARIDQATALTDVLDDPGAAGLALYRDLQRIDLPQLMRAADAGDALRLSLAPLAHLCTTEVDRMDAPPHDIAAWALRCARAMVWLRLSRDRTPTRTAELVLAGAVALYAAHPESVHVGLAGWCRALRTPALRPLE